MVSHVPLDQGLALAYAFNRAEAARSFRRASNSDKGCPTLRFSQGKDYGSNPYYLYEESANCS